VTNAEVKAAVDEALKDLEEEVRALDFAKVHERSTAHRLAVHLESKFPGWDVDCEYDRDLTAKKLLAGIAECNERRQRDDIFPDIIVHHRGLQGREDNLLAIEIKKNCREDPCDRRKLELLTKQQDNSLPYRYQFGLYLNFNFASKEFDQTWYKRGCSERI